jgi:L-lactate dehydrogenase complex protein LldG
VISQHEFLTKVANRLGRSEAMTAKPEWTRSKPLPNPGPTDKEALAERFCAELQKLSGKTYRAASAAAVPAIVTQILKDAGAEGHVVRWDDHTLDGLGIDEAVAEAGLTVVPVQHGAFRLQVLDKAEQAFAGITGVDMAIAETGTLVMGSSKLGEQGAPGRGRTVSLLPPLHIAIVRKEQLVYSTVAVFRHLAVGPMPSQVVFASGPSRSADIENDLSIGVHGPKQVHVIVV